MTLCDAETSEASLTVEASLSSHGMAFLRSLDFRWSNGRLGIPTFALRIDPLCWSGTADQSFRFKAQGASSPGPCVERKATDQSVAAPKEKNFLDLCHLLARPCLDMFRLVGWTHKDFLQHPRLHRTSSYPKLRQASCTSSHLQPHVVAMLDVSPAFPYPGRQALNP